MRLVRDVAIGVTAGAIFAVGQQYLFPLNTVWKWVGIATVFLVAVAGAALADRSTTKGSRAGLMSRTRTKGNLDASVRGADVETDAGADIMSDNIVEGDARYTIEDSKIGPR